MNRVFSCNLHKHPRGHVEDMGGHGAVFIVEDHPGLARGLAWPCPLDDCPHWDHPKRPHKHPVGGSTTAPKDRSKVSNGLF